MSASAARGLFSGYTMGSFVDEMFDLNGIPYPECRGVVETLDSMTGDQFRARQELADLALINQGITFTVYGDAQGVEKPFPVDLVPRIVPADQWETLERGLIQRVHALNLFLEDVYGEGLILKDHVLPRDLVVNAANYRREVVGSMPRRPIRICGTDLIRDGEGTWRVLEDNCRTPSGVSYMLENRLILMRTMPEVFRNNRIRPIDHYTEILVRNLKELAPPGIEDPTIVVLTPGQFNSAYFEHTFLALAMGLHLVEGRDLFVFDNCVFMRTTGGPKRVHVIYRRVDDDFLDPLTFRGDSALGAPGLVNAYRAGNVGLANGIGTGVADDKAVYPFVPKMIRYYLDEEPILANVETFSGVDDLEFICREAHNLVIKSVNEAGGYGMLMGPQSTPQEIDDYLEGVRANPRNYVAQRLIALSTSPCYIDQQMEPRHVDLRPYVLCGNDEVRVVPGGLTRVALKKGSYVVNSSQGGGSKDTWVVDR
jgi:uncharacterized circularly permuted ATP-grasp superfamily protein